MQTVGIVAKNHENGLSLEKSDSNILKKTDFYTSYELISHMETKVTAMSTLHVV